MAWEGLGLRAQGMNFSQVALARPVGGHGQDACNGNHDPGDPNSPMYIGNIGLGV